MPDPSANAAARAVFLSYASQDAEAATRICESLRAAGVVVWFDQNELVGGDAWDQKIRKQIKDCALFVPIVSAATQARREGYFRLEWKLADDRTHLMAKGTPFLLPVCIDDTKDWDAIVPDSFMTVQWTRLPGGETPQKFCERVKKLLGGEVAQASPPASAMQAGGTPALPPKVGRRVPAAAWLGLVAVVIVIALARPWRWLNSSPAATSASSSSASRSSQLAQRARIETPDQLVVAIDLARRATERSPNSAPAWAALARLETQFIRRGWDITEQRRQDTQTHANKALAMDRNDIDAIYALAIVLQRQGAYGQVEAMMRRAIEREPNDAELRQALGGALSGQGRHAEALAVRQETLRLFPRDALAHYDLALSYEKAVPPDFDAALRKFDDSLALGRSTSTVLHQVALLAGWRGDLPAARQLLDTLDPLERIGDRAVGVAMTIGLLEQKPERTIEAGGLTARNYLDDDYVRGPKAWLLAHAGTLAGKPTLAQAQWQEAENVLRQRARAAPGSWFDDAGLAVTLAWLGATNEAARIIAPLESLARESPEPLRSLYLAYYHAGNGDAAKTAAWLELVVNRRELVTIKTLPLDPWWAKVRGKTEFDALRVSADSPDLKSQRQTSATAAAAPDAKSVAVLAFKNLSGDPAREFFSDGLSEAVTDVLGRVPGLKVVGSASAFSFKGKAVPIPEIARQLGVSHLVEGTVLQEGQTVRITAKLIQADGFQVWVSDKLDRELKNIFALHDEVAGLIAKNLSLKLGVTSAAATAVVNPQAFELYLQGRQAWNLRTTAGYARAEELLNRALALDPSFARARAALADVALVREQSGGKIGSFAQRDSPELAKIVAQIERALALDPNSAEAHASLGNARWMGWQLEAAARELRGSIALNPNYASAHQWVGRVLLNDGRMDEGLAELKLAAELDPLSARILDNYSWALRLAGNYTESLAIAERAVAVQPDSAQALTAKSTALLTLHRMDEAVAIARRLTSKDSFNVNGGIMVLAGAGLKAEAEAVLPLVTDEGWKFFAFAALGRREESVAAFDAQRLTVITLGIFFFEPACDSMRADPRVAQALATVGATEAHARAQAWRAAHPPQTTK